MATNGTQDPLQEAQALLSRTKNLSQRVQQCLNREVAEHDELGTQVKQVITAHKQAVKAAGDNAQVKQVLYEVKQVIDGVGPGGDLKRLTTGPHPWLLGLLLGRKTCVVAWSTSRSLSIKEEYHAFKTRSAYTMALFSALLLVGFSKAEQRREAHADITLTPPLLVAVQCFIVWMLYFYCSMALRENVLMVNGSNIRPWWIHHHYWSIFTCFLFLTIPIDSPVLTKYIRRQLMWTALQSSVMLLQNRYQRRRMYTRIALGKNNAMDVLGGESSGGSGQLLVLYPLLFVMQVLQIAVGLDMVTGTWKAFTSLEGFLDLEQHESDLWGNRGVFIAGACTTYMGLQNFRNTILTIAHKRKAKRCEQRLRDGVRKDE